jgi:hypothetical protein
MVPEAIWLFEKEYEKLTSIPMTSPLFLISG